MADKSNINFIQQQVDKTAGELNKLLVELSKVINDKGGAINYLKNNETPVVKSLIRAFITIDNIDLDIYQPNTVINAVEKGNQHTILFLRNARNQLYLRTNGFEYDDAERLEAKKFFDELSDVINEVANQADKNPEAKKYAATVSSLVISLKNELGEAKISVVPTQTKGGVVVPPEKRIATAVAGVLIAGGIAVSSFFGGKVIGRLSSKAELGRRADKISELNSQVTTKTYEASMWENRFKNTEKMLQLANAENDTLKAENDKIKQLCDAKTDELAAAEATKADLDEKLANLQDRYNALVAAGGSQAEIDAYLKQIDDLKIENGRLNVKISVLENQLRNYDSYKNFYESTMDYLDRYNVSNINQLVSLLDVNVASAISRADAAEKKLKDAEDRAKAAQNDKNLAVTAKNAAVAALNTAIAERDDAIAERNSAIAERDEYKEKYDDLMDAYLDLAGQNQSQAGVHTGEQSADSNTDARPVSNPDEQSGYNPIGIGDNEDGPSHTGDR